ncbi:NIPSNAP family protein [Halalkalibaculum sp. DA384]|uniref:NIPSNAP family protein n=1 Tax=Halalkalibaculum sp. DA384 TaxID=3373606 RepID=UPI00375494CB
MIHSITTSKFALTLCLIFTACSFSLNAQNSNADRHLYQLKVYHLEDSEQEQQIDDYLSNAYIPALHRMGHQPVGVFKPIGQDTLSDKRIYVLTAFDSFSQFESLDNRLANDDQYKQAGASYIQAAHDSPPFTEIETVLLRAFSHAPTIAKPELNTPKSERVYELRSYESATEALNINKVEMFNEGGEIQLFEDLDFNAIFYGNVLAGSNMPNLMYMTSFNNMHSRDAHWESFRNSPVWDRMSSLEKYQNNVSHADIYLLRATEYSDL